MKIGFEAIILTTKHTSSTYKFVKQGDLQLEHVEYFWKAVISLTCYHFSLLNKRAELKLLEEERIQIQTWRKNNYQLSEWKLEFEAS